MEVKRLFDEPIIEPNMDNKMGNNINGPSLIKVPEWLENPLGKYYLYFAHHQGEYIRLAYSDKLEGPWKIYSPGSLQLDESFFENHIASPDVHIDNENEKLIMYYHGCCNEKLGQITRVATSRDGINFKAREEILGSSYWRVFKWRGYYYSIEMRGQFYRSKERLTGFKKGPKPSVFTEDMRHSAVTIKDDRLLVFYSIAGDCPEHIVYTTFDLTKDWKDWEGTEPQSLLKPEKGYEGGDLELEPSERGSVHEPVRQLRDPAIYEENETTYLLYSVAGEYGIAIAELIF